MTMQNLLVAVLALSPLAAAFAPAPQSVRAASAIQVSRVKIDWSRSDRELSLSSVVKLTQPFSLVSLSYASNYTYKSNYDRPQKVKFTLEIWMAAMSESVSFVLDGTMRMSRPLSRVVARPWRSAMSRKPTSLKPRSLELLNFPWRHVSWPWVELWMRLCVPVSWLKERWV